MANVASNLRQTLLFKVQAALSAAPCRVADSESNQEVLKPGEKL